MPIATPEVYAEMLGQAKQNSYAFPAINCTSSETVNAAIKVSPTPAVTESSSSRPVAQNSAPASGSKTW